MKIISTIDDYNLNEKLSEYFKNSFVNLVSNKDLNIKLKEYFLKSKEQFLYDSRLKNTHEKLQEYDNFFVILLSNNSKDDILSVLECIKKIYINYELLGLLPKIHLLCFLEEDILKYTDYKLQQDDIINKVFCTDKYDFKNINIKFLDNNSKNIQTIQKYIKIEYQDNNHIKNIEIIQDTKDTKVLNETISVFGTSGSGKSYVSHIIATYFSRRYNLNTFLIDFGFEDSSIDILNRIEDTKNYDILNILEKCKNGMKKKKEFDLKSVPNNKNLFCITNNCSIYDIQKKLDISAYENILNTCNLYKPSIKVVDLTSSIFIDVVEYMLINSSKIIFVITPDYVSIRQSIKYLDVIVKVWGVPKSKIAICINKYSKDGLCLSQIKKIFNNDYEILIQIPMLKSAKMYINSLTESLISINYLDKILSDFCTTFGLNTFNNKNGIDIKKIYSRLLNKEIKVVDYDN